MCYVRQKKGKEETFDANLQLKDLIGNNGDSSTK